MATVYSSDPLGRGQMEQIHLATLQVLDRTGLRVGCREFYPFLSAAGARVDEGRGVVTFPPRLIEDMLAHFRSEIASGRRQYILNGVTNPRWTPPAGCKFGGACIEYLDPETQSVRAPTEQDLIRLLQLGEALDSVGFVGNPVACLIDAAGRPVPNRMQRVKTASVVAKYTRKCGSTEVWDEWDLDFLMEIGRIVRGGAGGYDAEPCFVTAKETIAPLRFPEDDGRVLLMLARHGLPCTVIPMPLTGATSPCSVASNIIMANAEILGAMTCIHVAVPAAMIGGGVISGIMDMSAMAASFSAPEALLQDAGLAQLYDQLYGQDLAIGTGYIDAKYPGAQSLAEKALKMQFAARQGRFNFPVGLLAGGKRFSPVEAVLELEIAESIRRMYAPVDTAGESLAAGVIAEIGIGGEFLSHEHTLDNFRSALWRPELMDRTLPGGTQAEDAKDMLKAAREKVLSVWSRTDLYRIDDDRARAIDDVVKRAERQVSN